MVNKKIKSYRPTWAEINLKNLVFNYRQLRRLLLPKTKVLAAVKANAYGHGIFEVSRKLQSCGVDYLGVASIDEALFLRKKKIKTPILVLGTTFSASEVMPALAGNITLTVADYKGAKALNSQVNKPRKLKVHIKVDTGMGRIGMWHEQAQEEIIKISYLGSLHIEGIYTHLPSADTDVKFTHAQAEIFQKLITCLKARGIVFELVHAANSIGACILKSSYLNMIRPGIMLYGIYPCKKSKKLINLKPVLSLMTRIIYIKKVAKGRSISYGRTYVTKKPTRIITLPVGYADGYPRALSNKARVLIKGRFFPVVGRVCMDQTMVDIGLDTKVKLGEKVTLIGKDFDKVISAEELATACNTIAYETTCWISSRVPRLFKNH